MKARINTIVNVRAIVQLLMVWVFHLTQHQSLPVHQAFSPLLMFACKTLLVQARECCWSLVTEFWTTAWWSR